MFGKLAQFTLLNDAENPSAGKNEDKNDMQKMQAEEVEVKESAQENSNPEEIFAEESQEQEGFSKELSNLRTEVGETKAKLSETHDKMLRIAADFENARKRWERERQEVRAYSITEFARDLLPVIDAFDKAIHSIDSLDINLESDEGRKFSAVAEGIQMVSKIFHDSVKKHGVERIPGKGEVFNPMFHNAVAKVVDETVSQDTVLDEFVPGYKIGDRVLRTAMVRVATKD